MKEKKVIDYTIEADKKKCILYIVILLLLGFLLMWTQIDDLTRWILFYKRTPKENKCQSVSYTHLDVYKRQSYSFVDESNRLVCPTNNNHVLMLKATDEDGNVLPEFEKVLDIDIKAAAEAALGKTLDQKDVYKRQVHDRLMGRDAPEIICF